MREWQLQEAKAKLSELVNQSCIAGVQQISVRGVPKVVVISFDEYKKLINKKPDLVTFLQNSPLSEADIPLNRLKSKPRNVKL